MFSRNRAKTLAVALCVLFVSVCWLPAAFAEKKASKRLIGNYPLIVVATLGANTQVLTAEQPPDTAAAVTGTLVISEVLKGTAPTGDIKITWKKKKVMDRADVVPGTQDIWFLTEPDGDGTVEIQSAKQIKSLEQKERVVRLIAEMTAAPASDTPDIAEDED